MGFLFFWGHLGVILRYSGAMLAPVLSHNDIWSRSDCLEAIRTFSHSHCVSRILFEVRSKSHKDAQICQESN